MCIRDRDEGAAYFGEVALVPYDSPISNQKILFYNTLFDENAACHIAFGQAYPCIQGGQQMTKDELKAHGLNDSITHVDFMVGTPDPVSYTHLRFLLHANVAIHWLCMEPHFVEFCHSTPLLSVS